MSSDNSNNTTHRSGGVPVAVLYTFPGSCYASAAQLALIEKGYSIPEECNIVNVDLLSGANFSPEFLKINTKGTVPTLVVPQLESAVDDSQPNKYTALTETVKILEFLDKKRQAEDVFTSSNGNGATSPSGGVKDTNTNPARSLAPASLASKARDDDIIKLTQSAAGDPNLLLLVARNEAELKAKNEGLPGHFVRGRKKALEGYLADLKCGKIDVPNKERLEGFYNDKLAAMNNILQAYENPSGAGEFVTKGQAHWLSVTQVLLELNSILPREDRSDFITLADLHAGAWFARILACVGATDLKDVDGSFKKLAAEFGRSEEEMIAVKNWWSTMVTRKSFQQVYGDGLH